MKVLYIATSFPKPDKGATIYTDLAETLHEMGHELTVVVSEEAKNTDNTIIEFERGFEVLRIVTGNYYDVSLVEKGITTLRIPYIMKRGITKYLNNRKYDFILFESPPVTNVRLVGWAKKIYNCQSYLMLKDIFPQNAVDIGIMKNNSIIYKYFLSKEQKLYKSADFIGCMSEANRQYIISHNSWIDSSKVELFPNTKKISRDYLTDKIVIRKKYSIPKEVCVFLFGGNMGKPQYVDLLCYAVKECKDERGIYFLFIGRGTERYKLEKMIRKDKITNACVIENLPRAEYEQIIKECNVGLITLDPRFTIPNYPSRLLSYMEYAKPVLAATDKVTDLKVLIKENKCGEWVWSGDKNRFVEKIRHMAKSLYLKDMGNEGRAFIENNFNIYKSVQILEKHFNN